MRCWRPATPLSSGADDLLVVFGDTPLISAETFSRLRAPLRSRRGPLRCLAFAPPIPTGYGRLLVEGDRLVEIREDTPTPRRRNAPSSSAMPA